MDSFCTDSSGGRARGSRVRASLAPSERNPHPSRGKCQSNQRGGGGLHVRIHTTAEGMIIDVMFLHHIINVSTATAHDYNPPSPPPPLTNPPFQQTKPPHMYIEFTHSYLYSLSHTFIHSLIHTFIHSFIPSFIHLFMHSFHRVIMSYHVIVSCHIISYHVIVSYHIISCHVIVSWQVIGAEERARVIQLLPRASANASNVSVPGLGPRTGLGSGSLQRFGPRPGSRQGLGSGQGLGLGPGRASSLPLGLPLSGHGSSQGSGLSAPGQGLSPGSGLGPERRSFRSTVRKNPIVRRVLKPKDPLKPIPAYR